MTGSDLPPTKRLEGIDAWLVENALQRKVVDCAEYGAASAGKDPANAVRAEVLAGVLTSERATAWNTGSPGFTLRGAHVKGRLQLSLARLAYPLRFDGCRFADGISFAGCDGVELSFVSCGLGELDCSSLSLSRSLHVDESELTVFWLTGAEVAGVVSMDRTAIKPAGGQAILADRLSAQAFFLKRCNIEGEVRLVGATIAGPLSFESCSLAAPDAAITAESCQIGGPMVFRLAGAPIGEVDLAYGRVGGPLIDELDSWPALIRLAGFEYRSIEGPIGVQDRLDWVRRSVPFVPGVYSQLALAYRSMGQEASALKVLVARERDRTRRGGLSGPHRLWRTFLGVSVDYGYRPSKVVVPFLVVALLLSVVFSLPAARTAIVSRESGVQLDAAAPCETATCYSAPAYVLDTMLPVVDLHQEDRWEPAVARPWGWLYRWLMWFMVGAGWLLTTALVAGISSAWRKD